MSTLTPDLESRQTEPQDGSKSAENGSKSVAFYTLGCKANQLETSTLAQDFKKAHWSVVPFDEAASVYVINTCTVTERSDVESRRIVRRAKLSNPEARIVVTGCYAQVSPEELAALPGVTHVIGNNHKDEILAIVENTPLSDKPVVQVSEIDKSRIMAGASSAAIDRTRGSLKIQDGCDFKCTYCIIWEARGLSRSLPMEDIKAQLQRMIWEGFREIVLTGINIGQYEHESADLADLLAELVTLEGDFRLRLSSLDPVEVTDKLIDVMADSPKICPYFHLSAQSAEDVVLKRMGRRHHVADMERVCARIAEKMPDACVGSDIIVGFPGETPERFQSTYDVLSRVNMNYFHVFSYSKRKGTPAASFPDQVPEREKKARAARLRELSDTKNLAYRQHFIGRELTVIVEDSGQKGMSENYIPVQLNKTLQANDKATITLSKVDQDGSYGDVQQVVHSFGFMNEQQAANARTD